MSGNHEIEVDAVSVPLELDTAFGRRHDLRRMRERSDEFSRTLNRSRINRQCTVAVPIRWQLGDFGQPISRWMDRKRRVIQRPRCVGHHAIVIACGARPDWPLHRRQLARVSEIAHRFALAAFIASKSRARFSRKYSAYSSTVMSPVTDCNRRRAA